MKFNPNNKKILSVKDIGEPIHHIFNKDVAREYYKDYIIYIMKLKNFNFSSASNIAKLNILFYINNYNISDVERVTKLFDFDKNKTKILRNIKLNQIENL